MPTPKRPILRPPADGEVQAAAYLREGVCPICGRGTFKVPATHVASVHGIDRFALRDMAFLLASDSICDPQYSASCASRQRTRDLSHLNHSQTGRRRYNRKARQVSATRLLTSLTPAERSTNAAKASAAAWGVLSPAERRAKAKRAAKRRNEVMESDPERRAAWGERLSAANRRRRSGESNPGNGLCRPAPSHSATAPEKEPES